MMESLFLTQPYLQQSKAVITDIHENGALRLDRSLFYYESGGQPGDKGVITRVHDAYQLAIADCRLLDDGQVWLIPNDDNQMSIGHPMNIGDEVDCTLDWQHRYPLMQMHTALHLLCALVPCKVNGCQVGNPKSRIDFHVGDDGLDKEELQKRLDDLLSSKAKSEMIYYEEATLDNNPDLVRTMSVKPPRGQGTIRFLRIFDGDQQIDIQPCGGTHVASLSEIPPLRIGKIESKGGGNKRINLHFA